MVDPLPLTLAQRAFRPLHNTGDLPAAVRLARHVVTGAILSNGVSDDAHNLAELLAGDYERGPNCSVSWDVFCEHLFAALAMGIAIGQLVHLDVYVQAGGAKPYAWKCDDEKVTKKAGAR